MSLRVVSLFAGCGGLDMALYRAADALGVDVEVVAAYDTWPRVVATYNRNVKYLRHSVAQVADVKTLQRSDLPPHDLVMGGPPCQPFSNAGKLTGHGDPRNCIPDFVRLSEGVPYVMENVKHRLLDPYRPGYWSEQFCAADFGDVTSRKRWFYSSHLLYVIPTPGPRRFRDIRDPEADRLAADRSADCARKKFVEEARQGRTYNFEPRPDDGFIGSLGGRNYDRLQSGSTLVGMRSYPQAFTEIPEDGFPGSLTSHSHTQLAGQSRPTQDTEVLGTLTSGKGGMSGFMKVALRSHGSNYQTMHDDAFVGSATRDSTHNLPTIAGVRCVSLLEMQRAHSFPEDFDWGDSTKSDRGKMVANSVPIGLGTAVLRAMLVALGVAKDRAA